MQNSKYTVLMSVYYKEKPEYLSLSIESMLNQTVKPDEFIIVKDGPLTAELDGVINNFVTAYPKMFNIIANETNLGLGPALAKGIENSKNELIARMDSDDYVISTRCEKQLEKFREDATAFSLNFNKEFVIVYPGKYSTRLQSILEILGLTNRVAKNERDLSIVESKIDYNRVNKILAAERKRSLLWLSNALSGVKNEDSM